MDLNLENYIVVFESIISDELCDEIFSEYENNDNWVRAAVGGGVNENVRKCSAINMTDQSIIQQNQEKRKGIDDKLFLCAGNAIKNYNQLFNYARIQGDSGYTLLRYKEGEFYSEHTDHFLQSPRSVSCSFTLNDNFDGGEFAFFNRKLIRKPPKGSALMFPSNFMYPHEVMPVTRGTRYSIITWFI